MSDDFVIHYDIIPRLVYVDLRGFWGQSTLSDFMTAVGKLLHRSSIAGLPPGDGKILVRLSDFPVQDKLLANDLAALIPLIGRLVGRIAIVANKGALAKLQVRRLVADNARVFADETEARAWLADTPHDERQAAREHD